jgi:hypothetical protein
MAQLVHTVQRDHKDRLVYLEIFSIQQLYQQSQ